MIFNRTVYTYTFRNARWSQPTLVPSLNKNPNMPMVTDPAENQVYIINGFVNVINDDVLGAMQYDPSVPTVMNPMRESTRLPLDGGYAAVWSTALNVVVAYGGFVRSTPPTYSESLYEFNPQNSTFLSMGGTNSPAARYGHCMVEAYNGSQIILFGGADKDNEPLSDLHILDVATLTWTQQKVTSPPRGRAYPCCAVTNDMFVAWSGAQWDKDDKEFKVIDEEVTIVFNLKTKQWQSTFSPDNSGNTTGITETGKDHPTTSSTKLPEQHDVSIEAVVGGAIAGLAVVLAGTAGLLYFCRMKAKKKGWAWRALRKKDGSPSPPPLPPMADRQSLTSAAVSPAGNSAEDDAERGGPRHGGDDDSDSEDDHNDIEHHSDPRGAGTRDYTANILSSSSISSSQEKQQQTQQVEPSMSPTTIGQIPYSPIASPTTPYSSALSNTSITSVAAAFVTSLPTPSAQTGVSVSSELATEGETSFERGERRSSQVLAKKVLLEE
ncbi:hypothetical protein BGZ96_010938 [Linnemannia gamsii]|uniref:Galactose oxidase n=1 Tax=Linnemannia gamsii TaxID=64522 RepID=A0ABQ7KE75_9FUNG|nr:hypothetical protein BGZ96_010938 [Linnemannia gamsii]